MPTRALVLGAVFVAALLSVVPSAQTPAKPAPSFEWIFGEGRTVGSVPSTQWLSDGTLLMFDTRPPAPQRAFEIVDPPTGARRKAFDMAAAVRSLGAAWPASTVRVLGWPQALDAAGRRALYLFDGDLFLLDLATSTFARLTATSAEERSPEFSPDGRRLAFVRANDLFVVDCATRAETRVTRDGSDTTLNGTLSWLYWEEIFGRRDIGYWWSPDSKSLAYLQTDESKVPISTFVDFQPETPRVITQRYPKAGSPNPLVRVGLVDAGGGETKWVGITDKPFDTLLRVKWLPDGNRVSVQTQTRDQKEVGLYLVDRATAAASRILTETADAWINIHDDLHFLADGKSFLWASERDGYDHLYRYTLDGRLVNQVTRGPWALASSAGGVAWVTQAVAGIDEAAGQVYFTAKERSSITRDLYRVALDGSGMTRLSAEPGAHRISMSPDTRYYVDTFSDTKTLPSVTLRRADGSPLGVLAPPRTELLAPYDIQMPELTTIPASDGFNMPARVLKPANFRADRRHAVIIHVYGAATIPNVADAWVSDTLFYQLLLAEGYVIVKVDNRAATGISRMLANTVIGRLGEGEAADLADAAAWLKRQSWVDPDRIGLWGWSHGGYMTLNVMTRSNAFKAGISVAPVTDWRFYDSRWSEAFLGMPQQNPALYDAASPITRASALHGRVLVVYGTYDDNVHPQNELAFIDALVKAGKLFEMIAYPMRKHDIGDRDATVHLYRTMLEFWKKNL